MRNRLREICRAGGGPREPGCIPSALSLLSLLILTASSVGMTLLGTRPERLCQEKWLVASSPPLGSTTERVLRRRRVLADPAKLYLATTVRRAGEIGRGATKVNSPKGIVQVTVSMGITCARGDRDANVETLLNEADMALYRAKENGRNRVEAY